MHASPGNSRHTTIHPSTEQKTFQLNDEFIIMNAKESQNLVGFVRDWIPSKWPDSAGTLSVCAMWPWCTNERLLSLPFCRQFICWTENAQWQFRFFHHYCRVMPGFYRFQFLFIFLWVRRMHQCAYIILIGCQLSTATANVDGIPKRSELCSMCIWVSTTGDGGEQTHALATHTANRREWERGRACWGQRQRKARIKFIIFIVFMRSYKYSLIVIAVLCIVAVDRSLVRSVGRSVVRCHIRRLRRALYAPSSFIIIIIALQPLLYTHWVL